MSWELNLRIHGTVPHAGFGLDFKSLLMMYTGIKNIQSVGCFPRTPGNP
jgi:asparaginyl-tRNA synthetase